MFLYLWPNCVATHIAIDVEIGVTKYVANYETISMRRKSLMRMCSLAILQNVEKFVDEDVSM